MIARGFLGVMVVVTFAIGAMQPAVAQAPPSGATSANAAFPRLGAKWKVRVTENSGPPQDFDREAISFTFNGQSAYGIQGSDITTAHNPTTFSNIGSLKGGKMSFIVTPDSGNLSWPLWVGKSWKSEYAAHDLELGRAWGQVGANYTVASYEDVVVPAGTFKAFRIEQTPGGNNAATSTGWYSPVAKMFVKYTITLGGNAARGTNRRTTELLALPK